jgi:hypothetical protein
VQKSLEIMSRYTSLPDNSVSAVKILKENLSFYEQNFNEFMNELIEYIQSEHNLKTKKPEYKLRS